MLTNIHILLNNTVVERKENYEKAIIQTHALKTKKKLQLFLTYLGLKTPCFFFLFLITEFNYMSIHATSLSSKHHFYQSILSCLWEISFSYF